MKTRKKKQVIVDPDLYNRMRGKCTASGTTFSDWLEKKMQDELTKPSLFVRLRGEH